MKTRSIISYILLGVTLTGVVSCEKMMSPTSSITMTLGDHEWKAADTVYSVMGIIGKMQSIADRTVLFGELRGDLVDLNDNATSFLKEIASFDVKEPTDDPANNPYNVPGDYYAIINNCNYYLANADVDYKVNGEYIFLYEYSVVLSYRAWAYMQLAQIYGEVPFITEPIVDGASADVSLYPKRNIKQIAEALIPELEEYQYYPQPEWGTISENFNSKNVFIPTDLILADLYLWAGGLENYRKAAVVLTDYLQGYSAVNYNEQTVGINRVWWDDNQFLKFTDANYATSMQFAPANNAQVITYIPLHKNEYDGVTSQLENIFCSTEKNKNRYMATLAEPLKDICARQSYCLTTYSKSTGKIAVTMLDPTTKEDKLQKGDLRVNYIFQNSQETDKDKQNQGYGLDVQKLLKINPEIVTIYRKDLIYLRLAEALNRAGLSEMAFVILKYGLCAENLATVPSAGYGYISPEEKEEALLLGLDLWFEENGLFTRMRYNTSTEKIADNVNTMGIHSRGCGFSAYDDTYDIARVDTTDERYLDEYTHDEYISEIKELQKYQVEDYLIDELAMETCFEGNRFGDLMRFSMHRGEDMGAYADNDFLASRVAERDPSLYNKLLGDGVSYNSAWFIPLPNTNK